MLHGKHRLHGKHSQTLSVRELEAQEVGPLEGGSDVRGSSRTRRSLPETSGRLERAGTNSSEFRQFGPRPTLGAGARLIYFVFIGLWFGFVWLALGVALCLSLIGLPLGVWMLRHLDKAFALW